MTSPALFPEDMGAVTVCGGRIADPSRYPGAIYHGERIYFCTWACLRVFRSDPDRFMAGEIAHPLEEDED